MVRWCSDLTITRGIGCNVAIPRRRLGTRLVEITADAEQLLFFVFFDQVFAKHTVASHITRDGSGPLASRITSLPRVTHTDTRASRRGGRLAGQNTILHGLVKRPGLTLHLGVLLIGTVIVIRCIVKQLSLTIPLLV
jgi:hypothetical protein